MYDSICRKSKSRQNKSLVIKSANNHWNKEGSMDDLKDAQDNSGLMVIFSIFFWIVITQVFSTKLNTRLCILQYVDFYVSI